jgi:tight adherence protein C
MTALLVGVAVFLVVLAVRRPGLTVVVGRYVGDPEVAGVSRRSKPTIDPAVVVGVAVGVTLAPGGPAVGAMIGALGGVVFSATRTSSSRRHRSRRLAHELATVADMCALYVRSGDSVIGAMRRLTAEATGVAALEMSEMLDAVDRGIGFAEAARSAARSSAHRDGARLYELLAQAHRSGARLVDSLEMFAADRRAALERELTIEGGRRALASYGPILGLMIPTTLVFLMYPTLAGLDALASTR